MMFLYVMNGFDEGKFVALAEGETVLGRTEGRSGQADECLPGPGKMGASRKQRIEVGHDPKVSRVHVRLVRRGKSVSIEDAGSRHGTYVDAPTVALKQPIQVFPGNVIIVGETLFLLCETDQGRPVPPWLDDRPASQGGHPAARPVTNKRRRAGKEMLEL